MNRRHYLAASAAVAGTLLSGCAGLTGETTLGSPTEERDDEGLRLVYVHEGEAIATVSFGQEPDGPAIRRLFIGIERADDTTLERFRFRFAPEVEEPYPMEIYLRPSPEGWYEEHEVYRTTEATVVRVDGLGRGKSGTISCQLLVHGELDGGGDLPPLRIEHDLTLSRDDPLGERFAIHGERSVDLDDL
jgi:hypothetical protein